MYKKRICLPGCARQIDDYVWISLLEFNGLVKVNIETSDVTFVGNFLAEEMGYQLHSQIYEYKNKLFFIPWNSNNIAVYDIRKHIFRYTSLKDHNYIESGRIPYVCQKKEKLFLISENAQKIIEYNMALEKIEEIHILPVEHSEESGIFCILPVGAQNNIWKINGKNGLSSKINVILSKYEETALFDKKMAIFTGCSSENYIWLLTENTILYQFTFSGDYFREYDLFEIMKCRLKYFSESNESFFSICISNNIFIIWFGKNKIIQIPIEENIVCLDKYQIIQSEKELIFVSEGQMIMFENNKIIILDGDDQKNIVIENSDSFIKDIISMKDNKVTESGCIDLDAFISCLFWDKETSGMNQNALLDTSGSKIYRAIMQDIGG